MTELSHQQQKCRACLNENVPVVYLFQLYEQNQTLASILQKCINKEVTKTSIL